MCIQNDNLGWREYKRIETSEFEVSKEIEYDSFFFFLRLIEYDSLMMHDQCMVTCFGFSSKIYIISRKIL
jgi:hypothetical protein